MRRARVWAGFAGDRRTVSPLDIGGGEIRGLRPSYFASAVGPARELWSTEG